MANESISITPTDTANPTMLYRTLSRIIEAIDELKGYRGVTTDTSEVLQALKQQAEQLVNRLNSALADIESKLTQEVPKSVQDLAAEVEDLMARVVKLEAHSTVCGFAAVLTGNGSSNPSVFNAYNVDSVTRLGVGQYRIQLTEDSVADRAVLANAVLHTALSISSAVVQVRLSIVSATMLDVFVRALSVDATPALVTAAYDITSADRIDVQALLNPL